MRNLKSYAIAASLLSMTAVASAGSISGTVVARPSKYLAQTIVYVKQVPDEKAPPKTVQIDQRGMVFIPHIVLITTGDTVTFLNHDAIDHSVMSPEGSYDLGTFARGKEASHTFTSTGVFAQICKLHPNMLAYVFVGQNRFATVVDARGTFSLDGVPAGSYELDVWNPKLKAAPQTITVGEGVTTARFSIIR